MGDRKNLRMAGGKAVAKAWRDPKFRRFLIEDPEGALAAIGFDLPEGTSIRILEDTDDISHRVERLNS